MEMLSLQYPLYVPILSFLFFAYFLIKWLTSAPSTTRNRKNLPPSPPRIPLIGNFHQVGFYPHRSFVPLSKRYGPDLMLLHFGSRPVLVASSAEAARQIMKTHDLLFASRPRLSMTEKLLYNGKDVAAAPYGEYWRQMRSVCVLQLLSNKRVQSFRSAREEEVACLMSKIKQFSSTPVNLSQVFSALTNDVICRIAFGRKYNGNDEDGIRFQKLLGEFMRLMGSLNVGEFIPWLAWINWINGFDAKADKTAKEFDKFMDKIVEEHIMTLMNSNVEREGVSSQGTEDPKDFAHVLLELQKNKMAGFSLERENIKALLLDMFVGGSDTSSTVLEWSMTELIKHPRIMKELQNEIMKISHEKSFVTEADLDRMHYLKMVIKEALRLHSPFPLLSPRESLQDAKVMGYEIPAGTMVLINAWSIARDPNNWAKPEEFWPERFLNSSIDFKGHDFEFIPFGAGRRGCPGISFAMPIIELVLANLVKNFNWELPDGAKGEDLDLYETAGITTHRKNPLLAIAVPVSN